MKKSVFGILVVFILPLFSFAQKNKKVDSMKALLKTELNDTVRANTYNLLADRLRFTDPDQHKEFAQKGITLSRKINFQRGLGTGYNQYGIAMENAGRFE